MTRSPSSPILHQIPAQDGLRLGVWSQGSGYPILCLHGHPGSGQSMSVFAQSLSQRAWTLSPDLRGYGQSQPTAAFSMSQHLDDLTAILDHFHIQACLVLGWSLGGILAMELALQQPERIKGLILVATAATPYSNHPPVSWVDYAFTGVASVLNKLSPGWQWAIDTFGKRSLYQYLIQRHTPEAYRYLANEGMSAYLQTSSAANQALQDALRSRYDRLEEIQAIACPCLMLMGAEDRHITADSSRATAIALQNCEWHCYDQTAHLFPWEIPDQVLADIHHWLDQQQFCSGMGIT